MNARTTSWPLILAVAFTLCGCVTAPHEVVSLHEKQESLMLELRRTHLSLIDAYVNQRVEVFDKFYFEEYGPAYRKNWEKSFKQRNGRDYDPNRDFNVFHQDLVAEYEEKIKPVDDVRDQLKAAVNAAYDQVFQSHKAVGEWIRSVEKLNNSQRDAANAILKAAKPDFSLDSVDKEIQKITLQLSTAK